MAEFSQNAHLMTTHPKISVIIPCFNAEQYIVAAVHSVLAQNWPNLEIVVVDDGSSDHSAELVRNTFPEVRLIQQTNQGVAAARNNGLTQAQGDWIAFLDADDIWLPGKLQAQYHQLISVPDARMSYTAWQVWASTEPAPSPEYIEGLIRRSGDTKAWTGATGWIYPQLLLDCEV
jgi:glycosyltransferase involved in cell wall biosynthesis